MKKSHPKNLREKTGKKRGGQPGHKRNTLEPQAQPDIIFFHTLTTCEHGHRSLKDVEVTDYETRQVFDMPPLKIEVTEHRAEQKFCPHCQKKATANFPADVLTPTPYGSAIKSLAVYLSQYQFLPYERLQEFFEDILGHTISQGMLVKINSQCYENLATSDAEIKRQLTLSPNLHHDESGIRINGKLQWCHVASTPHVTHDGIHAKRGKEGIDAMGILPSFRGRLIHDFFRPYFNYDSQHALCNAHHLRELKFIAEEQKQSWAEHMANLWLAIKHPVEWHKMRGLSLPETRIQMYERCDDEIVMMGIWHPDNLPKTLEKKRRRGQMKQTKAKNLLDRLRFHREKVLAFMVDPSVPFTNNQAEQDIRMMKVKQKVSGCFRSDEYEVTFPQQRNKSSLFCKFSKMLSMRILIFHPFLHDRFSPLARRDKFRLKIHGRCEEPLLQGLRTREGREREHTDVRPCKRGSSNGCYEFLV